MSVTFASSTSNGERRTFGAPHRQFYIEMSPTLYGSVHSFTANNWLKNKTEDKMKHKNNPQKKPIQSRIDAPGKKEPKLLQQHKE